MQEELQLDVMVRKSGLEKPKAELIRQSFDKFFRDIAEWETKAKAIVVTDESQVDLMATAKEGRIFLRTVRKNAEATKDRLKEQILIEGRAISGIYNVIVGLIAPLEDHLEKQEKFKQVREAERIEEMKASRVKYLAEIAPSMFPILQQGPVMVLIATMDDAQFDIYAKGCKAEHDQKVEVDRKAAEKAEADRIAKEAEDKRIREENERLRKENEEKDRLAAQERQENNQRLAAERANKEKLEKELQAKKDKEEADKKAEAARKRKERTAPDREKLLNFADFLLTLSPVKVESEEARKIEVGSRVLLRKTSDYIKKSVKESDI